MPTTAEIACTETGAEVLTPRVAAQRDGVHFNVTNETESDLSVVLEWATGSMGEGSPASFTADLPVGTVDVFCYDIQSDKTSEPSQLEVVDPERLYVSPALAARCTGSGTQTATYAPDAKGEQGTPVEVAMRFLDGRGSLRAGDVLKPAGYPDAAKAVVTVVRRGETVAYIQLFNDNMGGWLFASLTACSGEGFD